MGAAGQPPEDLAVTVEGPVDGLGTALGSRCSRRRRILHKEDSLEAAEETATPLRVGLQLRLVARDAAERLDVAVQRAGDDLDRQLRRRRFMVPTGVVEPIADILFVE